MIKVLSDSNPNGVIKGSVGDIFSRVGNTKFFLRSHFNNNVVEIPVTSFLSDSERKIVDPRYIQFTTDSEIWVKKSGEHTSTGWALLTNQKPAFAGLITPTPTPTNRTPTPTPTVTPTNLTPTPTPTITPSGVTPTPTPTITVTPTITPTITRTTTLTPTISQTPTHSQTPSHTATPNLTPTVTITTSVTPGITPTTTPTVTATTTPTITVTQTPTITPTNTQTTSITPTITATITPTITPTSTQTPTVTPTVTATTTPTPTNIPVHFLASTFYGTGSYYGGSFGTYAIGGTFYTPVVITYGTPVTITARSSTGENLPNGTSLIFQMATGSGVSFQELSVVADGTAPTISATTIMSASYVLNPSWGLSAYTFAPENVTSSMEISASFNSDVLSHYVSMNCYLPSPHTASLTIGGLPLLPMHGNGAEVRMPDLGQIHDVEMQLLGTDLSTNPLVLSGGDGGDAGPWNALSDSVTLVVRPLNAVSQRVRLAMG